jgi:hypothetical protein
VLQRIPIRTTLEFCAGWAGSLRAERHSLRIARFRASLRLTLSLPAGPQGDRRAFLPSIVRRATLRAWPKSVPLTHSQLSYMGIPWQGMSPCPDTAARVEGRKPSHAKLFLTIVLLSLTCLPAAAQNNATLAIDPAVVPAFTARLERPLPLAPMDFAGRLASPPLKPTPAATGAFSARLQAPLLLMAPLYSGRTIGLTSLDPQQRSFITSAESAVKYVGTPFAEETRLAFVWLSGGRLQVGGFYSYSATDNVLMGPGLSSLPGWNVNMESHPATRAPRADESYGLSLSIRVKREAEVGPRIHLLRCLGWLGGARGCLSD